MVKMKQLFVSAALFAGIALAGPVLAANDADSGPMSAAKIDARTLPDAKVCIQGQDCTGGKADKAAEAAPAPAPAAAPAEVASADAAPAADSSAKAGEIFNSNCAMCHQTGAAGAPIPGDKAAWGPRIAQGNDTLYKHAIDGLNAMPPRGLCGSCSDDDLKAVVDFMVNKSK